MLGPVRSIAAAAGRHLAITATASFIAVGGAAGGVGYSIAAHTTSAPTATTAPAPPTMPAGGGHGHGKGGGKASMSPQQAALHALVAAVAKQTNQTVDQVRQQLQAGKSLDDIAGSQASTIEQGAVSKLQTALSKQVTAGKLTQDQADQKLAQLKTQLDTAMSEPGTTLLQQLGGHGKGSPSPSATATPAPTPTP